MSYKVFETFVGVVDHILVFMKNDLNLLISTITIVTVSKPYYITIRHLKETAYVDIEV